MRINKFIAQSGACSRRKADELIVKGKVKVNGEIISLLGYDVQNKDIVDFNLSEKDMQQIQQLNENHRIGPDPDNFDF